MKIGLIEITCPDIRAYGVRCLAGHLKQRGHDVRLVFLPPGMESLRHLSGIVPDYTQDVLDQATEALRDRDIVGVSFMTYYFWRAQQLAEHFRRTLKVPILAGGVHSTVRTEETLQYFDIAAQGEAEETLAELLETMEAGRDHTKTLGFWFKKADGDIVRNPMGRLVQNIEDLGFPDWSLDDHWAYFHEKKAIQKLDDENVKEFFRDGPLQPMGDFLHYKTMGSRGCPHNCSFCCVSTYRERYEKQRYLRWRPMDNFVEELVQIKNRFPYINAMAFFDDAFFSVSVKKLKDFCDLYKQRVGLPFAVQTSPTTTTPDKMELVFDAGMRYIEMGIQTGSTRIKERYDRNFPNERVVAAATYINKYKSQIMVPDYHLILDNPWETPEDVKDTLDLMLKLPRPFNLKPSSLVLYPGTGVHQAAVEDGHIKDERSQVYRKAFGAPHATWLNYLILLSGHTAVPRPLIRLLAKDVFVTALQKEQYAPTMGKLRAGTEVAFKLGRGLAYLAKGDFKRVYRRVFAKRAIEHAVG